MNGMICIEGWATRAQDVCNAHDVSHACSARDVHTLKWLASAALKLMVCLQLYSVLYVQDVLARLMGFLGRLVLSH